MFVCSRCGSSYNARHVGVEHCPRCRLRDKVDSPLAFKAFDLTNIRSTGTDVADRPDGSASTAMPSSAG